MLSWFPILAIRERGMMRIGIIHSLSLHVLVFIDKFDLMKNYIGRYKGKIDNYVGHIFDTKYLRSHVNERKQTPHVVRIVTPRGALRTLKGMVA